MPKNYIIYCDESDENGKHFSNFYGGCLINSIDHDAILNNLKDKAIELNITSEIKWSETTPHSVEKLIKLIDIFFDYIEQNKIKFRIMFTQNIYAPKNLTKYHRSHKYFILYYQFIKHVFGLQYANTENHKEQLNIIIYFDQLKINTLNKKIKFNDFICSLSNQSEFTASNVKINKNQIYEIDSAKNLIMQCTDIILGSIQSKLNDKHKEKPQGKRIRGKRTRAKEKLYKHINQRIRRIRPGFNVGNATSCDGDPANKWLHPYRHWNFIPQENELNLSRSKRAIKEQLTNKKPRLC